MKFETTMLSLVGALRAASEFALKIDTRPILTNCYLSVSKSQYGQSALIVSTDSAIMMSYKFGITSNLPDIEDGHAVFNPGYASKILMSMPRNDFDIVKVWTEEGKIHFEWRLGAFYIKNEDADYPIKDGKYTFPKMSEKSFTFSLPLMGKLIKGLTRIGFQTAKIILPNDNMKPMKVVFDGQDEENEYIVFTPMRSISNERR